MTQSNENTGAPMSRAIVSASDDLPVPAIPVKRTN
jgi:hypothetical protein